MKNIFLLCLCYLSILSIHAQTPEVEKPPFIKNTDFFLSKGYNQSNNLSGTGITLEEYNTLIPDANEYKVYSMPINRYRIDSYNAALGFEIRNKEKTGYRKNPQIRLGVNYVEIEHQLARTGYSETTRLDTLFNPTNGSIYYLDRIKSTSEEIIRFSKKLQLDAALIYRTNQDRMFSVYAGLGCNFGFSIQSTFQVYESHENTMSIHNEDSYYSTYQQSYNTYNDYTPSKTDYYDSKVHYNTMLYTPLGADLHISKKEKIYSLFHLFVEFRPSINFFSIREINKTYTHVGMYTFLGVRVSL